MKFTVIDRYGNAELVEADDIIDAIEKCWNNHTNYDHIMAVARIEENAP